MIIADVKDLHRIHDSSEDVLMLQLHLDTKKFEEIYPNISSTYFVCEDPGTLHDEDATLKGKQLLLKHQLANCWIVLAIPMILFTYRQHQRCRRHFNRYFRGFYMEDYQYRVGGIM
jgi:hypothetical protein